MSIEETTVEVPATTRTSTNVVCDVCGAKAKYESWGEKYDGYERTHTEVAISIEEKTLHPDDGSSDGIHYDCCPDCFRAKVIPALHALGLKPRRRESSW